MSAQVLIFEELLKKLPQVRSHVEGQGRVLTPVKGGRDALDQARTLNPPYVILDVAMPQMSGIEACRQIKEGAISTPPKILLVSELVSTNMRNRAEDAGCDLFVPADNAENMILQFLQGGSASSSTEATPSAASDSMDDLGYEATYTGSVEIAGSEEAPSSAGTASVEERAAPRVEIPGPIRYIVNDQLFPGESINVSESGILFAATEDISLGSSVILRFRASGGMEFDVPTSVVRTQPIKEIRSGLAFAVGGKFEHKTQDSREKLGWLLANRPELKIPRLSPEYVRTLLDVGPQFLNDVMAGKQVAPELVTIIGRVTSFERSAFSTEGTYQECVRRAVLLKAQCRAFRGLVPAIAKEPGVLGGTFLPLLEELLSKAESTGEEVEQHGRQAMNDGDDGNRQSLNETSTRLYEAKIQLMGAVASKISPEGLGSEAEIVKNIHSQAEQIQELRAGQELDLKYSRRPAPTKPKEEKKKKKGEGLSKTAKIALSSTAAFFVIAFGIYNYVTTRVSLSELKITIPIVKAIKNDEGLNIYVTMNTWRSLPSEDRKDLFVKMEKFLRKENLRQGKIYSEDGKVIAALLGSRQGKKRIYASRTFRR